MKCPFTLKVRRGGGTHKMRRRSQGSVRVGCFGGYHGAIVKPGALVEPATLVESAALVEPAALLPSSADPLPGVDDETLRYFWRKDPTIKAQQDFSSHLLPLVEPAALPPSSSADTPPGHKMRRRSQAAVHVGHFVVEPAARVEPTALLPSSFADPGGPPPDMDDEMVRRLWRKDPMFFKDVDDEIVQHLGKLGRRDPTAKIKSLSILSMLFAQKPDEEVAQIVPQWAFEYKRLLLDNNKDVRRAANDTMSSLARAAKKGLAPNLKHLMGPWWFSQFDTVTEVAEVSRHSFEVEFPQSNERLSALMLSLEETLLYLFENLRLTTQALTDKVTLIDEIQDTRQRVIPSSIAAIGALIDILTGVKLQSDGGDRESAGVIKGYHNTVFEEIFSEATPSSLRPNKEHISELEERLLHMERIYQEASSGRTHLEAILERVLHEIEETAKLVLGEGDDFLGELS